MNQHGAFDPFDPYAFNNFNNFDNFIEGIIKNVHKLSRGDAYHVVLGLQDYMMDEIDNRYKQKVITNMFETLRKKRTTRKKSDY